ncbi:MAG: hypothetical protein ACI9UJ_000884 [bacterium]|jgi:hypothetical protein
MVCSTVIVAQESANQVAIDSIPTAIDEPVLQQLDFLDVVPPNIEDRKKLDYPWLFIVAVVVLLFIGLIRVVSLQTHNFALKTAFSNISHQFEQNDKEAAIDPVIILQSLVSAMILAMGIFVMEPSTLMLGLHHGFIYYLILLLGICLVYAVKYCIHFLVGIVLQSDNLAKLMVVGLSGMLYAFTLLVFPLIVIWYYVHDATMKANVEFVLLTLSAVFVVWRLIKSVTIYYRYFPFAKVYIIIYLCALEITPLLIIGKLIGWGVAE